MILALLRQIEDFRFCFFFFFGTYPTISNDQKRVGNNLFGKCFGSCVSAECFRFSISIKMVISLFYVVWLLCHITRHHSAAYILFHRKREIVTELEKMSRTMGIEQMTMATN